MVLYIFIDEQCVLIFTVIISSMLVLFQRFWPPQAEELLMGPKHRPTSIITHLRRHFLMFTRPNFDAQVSETAGQQ